MRGAEGRGVAAAGRQGEGEGEGGDKGTPAAFYGQLGTPDPDAPPQWRRRGGGLVTTPFVGGTNR